MELALTMNLLSGWKLGHMIVESIKGGNMGILGEVWPAARDAIFSFILAFLILSSLMASMTKADWCLTSLSTPLQISIYGREFG